MTHQKSPPKSVKELRDPLVDSATGKRFKASLQGPVTGQEPDFLGALPMDNAVGAIVALTAEVWMLRERLAALEAELESRRLLPEGAVENHRDDPAAAEKRSTELAAFTERVLSELTRHREPVSQIDPEVGKYLRG